MHLLGSSKASSSSKRIELRSSYSPSFESSDFSRYTEATDTGTPPTKNHTSVILGGILGGIVGAVLLALIGYYCFKHRKKYWYHADGELALASLFRKWDAEDNYRDRPGRRW